MGPSLVRVTLDCTEAAHWSARVVGEPASTLPIRRGAYRLFSGSGKMTGMADVSPDQILSQSRAFMESRVLLTAVELGVFDTLAGRSMTAEDITKAMGWDPRGARILLDELVVMGLLEKHRSHYACRTDIAELLTKTGRRSLCAAVLHSAVLWDSWSDLTAKVVGTGTRPRRDELAAFIGTMHTVAHPIASHIAATVNPGRGSRLLDLGGGSGAYAVAFLQRDRSLKITLFDRPEVLPLTRGRLREAECEQEVTLVGGDFLVDPLPGPQDLVFLSAIVHSLGPEDIARLFLRVFDCLSPGGRVVIRDHIMSEDHLHPRAGALFAVNMLAATPKGSTYSYAELSAHLTAAGFIDVDLTQDGERMDALMVARKPST